MGTVKVAARVRERGERRLLVPARAPLTAVGWLLAGLSLAALLIAAAFQTHPVTDLAIGNRTQDDALIRAFHAAERQPASVGGRVYRWSQGESSVVLPGIGRTAATVTLTLAGGANPNPEVRVLANGGELTRLRLTPEFADYTLPLPAPYLTTGNLTLTLESSTFRSPSDRRELGVLVGRVRVEPSGGLARPPARPALALWGVVALLTLALVAVGLRVREAAIAGAAVALALAVGLIWLRLFVTVAAEEWLSAAVATLLLAVALRLLVPPVLRRVLPQSVAGSRRAAAEVVAAGVSLPGDRSRLTPAPPDTAASRLSPADYRWLLAAVIAVFAVRLGGLWHPATIVSDLLFHVHRFEDVLRGEWFQQIPAVFDAGRPVPYPPAAYALFAPFARVVPDYATLLTVGTQLLDALRSLTVGVVAWRVAGSRVAGASAAFIAGGVPVAFLLFSWGNLTDAVGEVALTLIFALLALALPRLWEPHFAVVFVAVTLFALLAHIGVAVATLVCIGAAVGVIGAWLLWRERSFAALRDVGPVVLLTVAAALFAVALYYRIPLTEPRVVVAESLSDATTVDSRDLGGYVIGAPRPDATIGLPATRTDNPLVAVAGQLVMESWAYYRLWPVLLAPFGVWLLHRGRSTAFPVPGAEDARTFAVTTPTTHDARGTRHAALVMLGWLLGTLALLVIGVLTGRFVRHAVSAIPAVAVGASAVIAYAWRWRWGRVAVVALLVATAAMTLLIWYGRITRTYHG